MIYTVDKNNLKAEDIVQLANLARRKSIEINKINSNQYELNFEIHEGFKSFKEIVPNKLVFSNFELIYFDSIIGDASFISPVIFDDFLQKYVDDNNLTFPEINFSIKIIDYSTNSVVDAKIKEFQTFLDNIRTKILPIVTCIKLICEFYYDLTFPAEFTFSSQASTTLLHKLMTNFVTIEELINEYVDQRNYILNFESSVNQNYADVFRFLGIPVFRTFNRTKYKNHKGLTFLSFLEDKYSV